MKREPEKFLFLETPKPYIVFIWIPPEAHSKKDISARNLSERRLRGKVYLGGDRRK